MLCVKTVQIRSYFWSVFSYIQSNTGKYGPEITPYLDTFHAVMVFNKTKRSFLFEKLRYVVNIKILNPQFSEVVANTYSTESKLSLK